MSVRLYQCRLPSIKQVKAILINRPKAGFSVVYKNNEMHDFVDGLHRLIAGLRTLGLHPPVFVQDDGIAP